MCSNANFYLFGALGKNSPYPTIGPPFPLYTDFSQTLLCVLARFLRILTHGIAFYPAPVVTRSWRLMPRAAMWRRGPATGDAIMASSHCPLWAIETRNRRAPGKLSGVSQPLHPRDMGHPVPFIFVTTPEQAARSGAASRPLCSSSYSQRPFTILSATSVIVEPQGGREGGDAHPTIKPD